MAGTLTTSIFLKFQYKFKERCKILFIEAYRTSIINKSISLDFEENDISAILFNNIDKNPNRIKWSISTNPENHLFDETVTFKKGFAAKFSRIDLRYSTFWKKEEYKYFVEAKNLKANDSGSKRRYIDTGIDNFLLGGKYCDCDGFLVGYILEGNINNCVEGVNKLLKKDSRITEILIDSMSLEFDLFSSNHTNKTLDHIFLLY